MCTVDDVPMNEENSNCEMELEEVPWYITDLCSNDSNSVALAIAKLKNTIIGSNRQKSQALRQGILGQVLLILTDKSYGETIRQDACIILGSLVKGSPIDVRTVVNADTVPKLISVICSGENDDKLVSYALGALSTIFTHEFGPTEPLFSTPSLIPKLLHLMNVSTRNQVAVSSILSSAISSSSPDQTKKEVLSEHGIVSHLAPLLFSPNPKVCRNVVHTLTRLSFKSSRTASLIVNSTYEGTSIPNLLLNLMTGDRPVDLQLDVAQCLTNLYREGGGLLASDPIISNKTLPTLVRLCARGHEVGIRIQAADTLAYCIEIDKELQSIAAISNHLLPTIAEFLKTPSLSHKIPVACKPSWVKGSSESNTMMQAAFHVFASLGANDEGIRKRIIETENLMDQLVAGLDNSNLGIVFSAIRCLHSLSRSVHQLRTTFKDHSVWKPLMKLLAHPNAKILNLASSALCNLILEFSPAKEHMLDAGAIQILTDLTRHSDPALRINGIWALMNVAFQADFSVKTQILKSLGAVGTDQIFRLLSDSETTVVMKTLGLLRNLLSSPHIDHIMTLYGTEIMQATILTLEGEHGPDVKEQALCMLANIADGSTAKEFIMTNEDVLKKITNYLVHGNPKLQVAAVLCVSNLAWKEEEGYGERQAKLKEMGVVKLLHQLITSKDQALFDRVKLALNQFNN